MQTRRVLGWLFAGRVLPLPLPALCADDALISPSMSQSLAPMPAQCHPDV